MLRYCSLIGLVLLVFCISQGHAISCFECNSHNDTRCELDVPPDDLKVDCSMNKKDIGKPYTLCRKIKQVIDFEVNGLPPDSRVIRSCGWDESSYKNRCYQRSGFGGRQEVCACNSDFCNGSGALLFSPLLTVALFLLLKLTH